MRLYHFTSRDHISGVIRSGISFGVIPVMKDCGDGTCEVRYAITGYQWLTSNPSFEQAWATQVKIKEDRTEFRVRVSIPKSARSRLLKWGVSTYGLVRGALRDGDDTVRILNSTGNPDEWWLYRGAIPSSWLRNVDRKPVPKVEKRLVVLP